MGHLPKALGLALVVALSAPALADPPPEPDLDRPMDMPEELQAAPADPVEYATNYIRTFHESICKGQKEACYESVRATLRWKAAPELAALIVEVAEQEDIKWSTLLVLVRFESSYAVGAKGKIGERGLVQVHGEAAKGQDLTTARGQLVAGARWWAGRLERCGDRLRALRAYQSGSCRKDITGARLRFKEIARIEADLSPEETD